MGVERRDEQVDDVDRDCEVRDELRARYQEEDGYNPVTHTKSAPIISRSLSNIRDQPSKHPTQSQRPARRDIPSQLPPVKDDRWTGMAPGNESGEDDQHDRGHVVEDL